MGVQGTQQLQANASPLVRGVHCQLHDLQLVQHQPRHRIANHQRPGVCLCHQSKAAFSGEFLLCNDATESVSIACDGQERPARRLKLQSGGNVHEPLER